MKASNPTLDEWICSIDKLHTDSFQSLSSGRNVQQVQDDGLVRTKHGTAGDHRGECIPNLTYNHARKT